MNTRNYASALLILCSVLLQTTAHAEPPHAATYDAALNTLPPDQCPAWTGGGVGMSPFVAGGILTFSSGTQAHEFVYGHYGSDLLIPDPFVFEFRMRLVTGTTSHVARAAAGVTFAVAPFVGNILSIGIDDVFLQQGVSLRGPSASVDTDNSFHTYRVEVSGGVVRVFYDTVLLLVGAAINTTDVGGILRISFGDYSSVADGISEWMSISHNASVHDCVVTPPTCVNPPSGLISWWPGDGNGDDIVGGGILTSQGTATFGPAKAAQGFRMISAGDAFHAPDSPIWHLQHLTVGAWVRATAATGGGAPPDALGGFIVTKVLTDSPHVFPYNSWVLAYQPANGRFSAIVQPAVVTGTVSDFVQSATGFAGGQFHHVAMTYDGTTLKLYVNGVLQGQKVAPGPIQYSDKRLGIGGHAFGNFPFDRTLIGEVDEVEFYNRDLSASEIQSIYDAGSAGKCTPGQIAGVIAADCPSTGSPLFGVTVDVYETGGGDLAASSVTDANGAYAIELPAGSYTVTVVTPLGYDATSEEVAATVSVGQSTAVDFPLSCRQITSDPRGIGFWKHQVGVATGGKGSAQIDGETLCEYLDIIESHFNSNALNQVVVYVPPATDECDDKLLVAKDLLNLKGNVGMTARAKQHFMALLLNVAAEYISLTEVVSEDGATLSQAITYCDQLLDDANASNDESVKDISEQVNEGETVAANVIQLATPGIAYSPPAARRGAPERLALQRVHPNPFNPQTTITYTVPADGFVSLTIYDIGGRVVRALVAREQAAGEYAMTWRGVDDRGASVASGIYFARLASSDGTEVRKLVLLK